MKKRRKLKPWLTSQQMRKPSVSELERKPKY
jgi:hypothetical protein